MKAIEFYNRLSKDDKSLLYVINDSVLCKVENLFEIKDDKFVNNCDIACCVMEIDKDQRTQAVVDLLWFCEMQTEADNIERAMKKMQVLTKQRPDLNYLQDLPN